MVILNNDTRFELEGIIESEECYFIFESLEIEQKKGFGFGVQMENQMLQLWLNKFP